MFETTNQINISSCCVHQNQDQSKSCAWKLKRQNLTQAEIAMVIHGYITA
jgi:hypothetical protein